MPLMTFEELFAASQSDFDSCRKMVAQPFHKPFEGMFESFWKNGSLTFGAGHDTSSRGAAHSEFGIKTMRCWDWWGFSHQRWWYDGTYTIYLLHFRLRGGDESIPAIFGIPGFLPIANSQMGLKIGGSIKNPINLRNMKMNQPSDSGVPKFVTNCLCARVCDTSPFLQFLFCWSPEECLEPKAPCNFVLLVALHHSCWTQFSFHIYHCLV